jgi:hypothetical protein
MKKVQIVANLAGALLLAFLFSGCGSLHGTVNSANLTYEHMSLARSAEPRMFMSTRVDIDFFDYGVHTDSSANEVLFLPPLIYWRALGYDNYRYGYFRTLALWPIISNSSGIAYNRKGEALLQVSSFSLCPIVSLMNGENTEGTMGLKQVTLVPLPIINCNLYKHLYAERFNESILRQELLNLPLIGPMFAWGFGKNRFLWIPYGAEDE